MTGVGTAQNVPFGRVRPVELPHLITAPNSGSARVVLYERRSRVVVIGGALRSRLEKPGSRRQRERPLLFGIPAEYALPARSGPLEPVRTVP